MGCSHPSKPSPSPPVFAVWVCTMILERILKFAQIAIQTFCAYCGYFDGMGECYLSHFHIGCKAFHRISGFLVNVSRNTETAKIDNSVKKSAKYIKAMNRMFTNILANKYHL